MQCNLDQRGRKVRLGWAVLCLGAAVALATLILLEVLSGWGWWLGAAILVISAALGYYEYRKGWCMMRAMGFKTPM